MSNGVSTLNKQNKTKPNQTKQKRKNAKEKRFIPPTLNEVEAYVKDKGLNVDAQKFVDYYEATNWKDKDGKQVLSWKGKAQTWDSRAGKRNFETKRGATFADLLREEYGDDQKGDNTNFTFDSNIVSEVLPKYDIQ